MRQIILYIAVSLDGYIADADGGVDWLEDGLSPGADDLGYAALLARCDTVLMGRRTYDQIVSDLSPQAWPYAAQTTYVLTHRPLPDHPKVRAWAGAPQALCAQLRAQPGRDIWLCGGAQTVRALLDCVDELQLTVLPQLRGGGVPLFPQDGLPSQWQVIQARAARGAACLTLRRAPRPSMKETHDPERKVASDG